MTAGMDSVDKIVEELEGIIKTFATKTFEDSQLEEVSLEEEVNSECPAYPRLQILKLKAGTFPLSKGKGTVESAQILEELKSSMEKEKAEVASTKSVMEEMRKQLVGARTEKEGFINNIKKFCETRGKEEEFILAVSQYIKNILCPSLESHHKTIAELGEELEGFQTKAEELKDSYHKIIRSHQQVKCSKKKVEQEQENVNMLQSRRSTLEMKIKETTTKLVENKERLQKQIKNMTIAGVGKLRQSHCHFRSPISADPPK
ncbi:rho-associated protein kinase 1-like isoform X2 [Macrobrachium nipponense]|uniref:rho-associated protein kinase 1-like isoform X2 n=1 Tax=Macrobrachium nipponense TaxID=159736 RepID=UPI0030C7C57D